MNKYKLGEYLKAGIIDIKVLNNSEIGRNNLFNNSKYGIRCIERTY
jgi:hypothetical protein